MKRLLVVVFVSAGFLLTGSTGVSFGVSGVSGVSAVSGVGEGNEAEARRYRRRRRCPRGWVRRGNKCYKYKKRYKCPRGCYYVGKGKCRCYRRRRR